MKLNLAKKLLAIVLVGATVSSCGLIYQPQKLEGTEFSEQQVNQVKTGLTKAQVQYYLGSPNLFNSVASDKWFYVQRDVSNRGSVSQKVFFVEFQNDKVTNFGWVDSSAINQK